MKRHGRPATVHVSELLVRTALPDFRKPQLPKERHDLAWLQNWHFAHGSRHFDGLCPHEDALELGVTPFEQHLNHFLKIGPELVQGLALTVRARKTWHPPNVETRVRVPLDDSREVLHDEASLTSDITRSFAFAPAAERPN